MFEWDDVKNAANIAKHGIGFARASTIFTRHRVQRVDVRRDYGEPRWISFGRTDDGAIVTVVHTQRGDAIRLISARPANRIERAIYAQGTIQQGTDR